MRRTRWRRVTSTGRIVLLKKIPLFSNQGLSAVESSGRFVGGGSCISAIKIGADVELRI